MYLRRAAFALCGPQQVNGEQVFLLPVPLVSPEV